MPPDRLLPMPALQRIIADRYGGRDLPITLVLPDGARRRRFARARQSKCVARSLQGPAGARQARDGLAGECLRPGRHRLLRQCAQGPRYRRAMVGAVDQVASGSGERVQTFLHQRRPNRANVAHHYDVSNAFYRLWLDERMVYSCAYFRGRRDIARRRAGAEARPHLPQAPAGAGREVPRHRLRLGRAPLPRGRELRRRRARHHAVAEPVRSRVARDRARAPDGPRAASSSSTTSTCPTRRVYDKIASVGMFEHVGVARFPKYFGKIYSVLKPGGFVMNHGITHSAFVGHAPRQRHRRFRRPLRLSRAASSRTCRK